MIDPEGTKGWSQEITYACSMTQAVMHAPHGWLRDERRNGSYCRLQFIRMDNGMYEQRFGLNRKPFQSVLTNADFYESTAYKDLSDSVLHALRSDLGVAVMTGPTGIGKTVTLDAFRRLLDRDGQAMVLRGGNIQTAADLLHSLHRRLIPPPGKQSTKSAPTEPQNIQRWDILERMQRIADFWGPTIILLDDAHLAGAQVFAELRTLMEEEADGHRLVRLLISGPISLEETLAEPAMADFAQRIRAHEFLQPFTSTESVAYLDHQITRVGGDTKKIFDPKAIERIVSAADGVPRCIDLLADESLMGANKVEASVVKMKHVDGALGRLRHLPHSWNVSLFSSDEEESEVTEDEAPARVSATVSKTAASAISNVVQTTATSVQESYEGTTAEASSGVIEIGATSNSSAPVGLTSQVVVDTAATPSDAVPPGPRSSEPVSRVQMSAPGVIEIGADVTQQSVPQATTQPRSHSVQSARSSAIEVGATADTQNADVEGHTAKGAEDLGTEVSESEFMEDVSETVDHAVESKPPPTTTPSKPVDFDRVFGAVSFAGGAVAVAKGVLSEGKVPSSSSTDGDRKLTDSTPIPSASLAPPSTEPSDVSLEHHMVLAQPPEGSSGADASAGTTNVPVVEDAVELKETESAVAVLDSPSETDCENTDDCAVADSVAAVDDYTPWQPAGSWVADADSPRRLFQSPGHANSSPVFDRYTWCELGRRVTAEPPKRVTTTATHSETIEWPPVVDGVAPANQIPQLSLDEDYTELLNDLGTLVESTSNTLNDHGKSSSPLANAVDQATDATEERHDSTINPDQWIDRIDHLIDSDSADLDVENDNHLTLESDSVADEEEPSTPRSGQRLFTLPIDLSDVDLTPQPPFTTGNSDQPASDSQSADSNNTDAELQEAEEDQLEAEIVKDIECGDAIQPASVTDLQQAYAPRLLSQARSKVTAMGTSVSGLKKAAGAESLSETVDVASTSPQLELHVSTTEDAENSPAESGGNFSNLFTRLRQLRKR